MRKSDKLLNPLEYRDRKREVEVEIITDFVWVRKAALNTIGKKYDTNLSSATTSKMKTDYFISEHSPIRRFIVAVHLKDISYPTSVCFCRHVHSEKFVSTSAAHRTKKKRSLDTPVMHLHDGNAQSFIDMMRKRLCFGCSQDTYLWAVAIKKALIATLETKELGECLVPNCIYRAGCPEFNEGCGRWNSVIENTKGIRERYKAYNNALLVNND